MSSDKEKKPAVSCGASSASQPAENGLLPRGLLGRQGTPLAPGGRLPSFKAPRDLTLGLGKAGVSSLAKPKKTFTPNIPVRRDRNKEKEEVRNKEEKKQEDKSKRDRNDVRGRGRGRGRGMGRGDFIQTMGSVFGEGIAQTAVRRGSGRGGRGDKDVSSGMAKPRLNLQHNKKVDKDEEDMMLKELLRDDFIDDLVSGAGCLPVQLPMVDTGRISKDEKEEDQKKSEIKEIEIDGVRIKQEKEEDEESVDNVLTSKKKKSGMKNDMKREAKSEMFHRKSEPREVSISEIITKQSGEGEFLFIQLPDCLPGLRPESNDTKVKGDAGSERQEAGTSSKAADSCEVEENSLPSNKFCTLKSLPEGYLGKLQVLKSGKTRLVLGNHILNLEMGTQVGFLQDLVSVQLDEENKCGDMTVLGHVKHRLVCSPDWETMLSNMNKR